MTETLKQILAICEQLDFAENEALRSHLYNINEHRKDALRLDIIDEDIRRIKQNLGVK